jgi:hypothetical protein
VIWSKTGRALVECVAKFDLKIRELGLTGSGWQVKTFLSGALDKHRMQEVWSARPRSRWPGSTANSLHLKI